MPMDGSCEWSRDWMVEGFCICWKEMEAGFQLLRKGESFVLFL